MADTPILDSPVYAHGFVVGRYLTAVADGPDLDRLMDFTPAKGKVIFTPEMVIRRHEGPVPALVVQKPVECVLDEQGYLTSPGGGRGVGLISGIYTVRFDMQGVQVPGPTRIEVKATHTEDAPLDLVLAMPEVVPPGSVVVVDETTAQRAEAAAARAESIVTGIEAEVRAVVLASPELKGAKGDPGDDGHTPDLTWQGTALAVDGVPGPDLRGPDGDPGPAPSLKIGTVTSGATPSATIKGDSPDLTLDLVLPKGDPGTKGDVGAPGVVSSASSYVIVGPGRPDQPATTGGLIVGSEPVGAEYRSTDGAQVGAFVWMKRPGGKWEVTDGRIARWVTAEFAGFPDARGRGGILLTRTASGCTLAFYNVKHATGATAYFNPAPGFAPVGANGEFDSLATYSPGGTVVRVVFNTNGFGLTAYTGDAYGNITYQTLDPWPTFPLPGSPA
ncbi:hypothetical protein [Micrococcus luteus]|uniref:hypothetical protein n=1 Tax=Micrococcus luteus TaxID=1270 RepID=UPI003D346B63